MAPFIGMVIASILTIITLHLCKKAKPAKAEKWLEAAWPLALQLNRGREMVQIQAMQPPADVVNVCCELRVRNGPWPLNNRYRRGTLLRVFANVRIKRLTIRGCCHGVNQGRKVST